MATASGMSLLALAVGLVGGSPAPVEEPTGAGATCSNAVQVRMFDMDGLGWRSSLAGQLHRVASRGTATIWTADAAILKELGAKARAADAISPRDVTDGAVVSRTKMISYVSHVEAEAKPNRASIETGIEARVCGRKLEQGYLADVALAETRLVGMHAVPVDPPAACTAAKNEDSACCANETVQPTPARSVVQVPEVKETEVEGEWLIPDHGILVVSLGVDTVADAGGKAVVRERLATIEVGPETAPTPIAVSQLNGGPKGEQVALMRDATNEIGPDRNAPEGFPSRVYADIVQTVPFAPFPPGNGLMGTGGMYIQNTPNHTAMWPQGRSERDDVARVNFEMATTPTPVLPQPAMPARMLPVAVDAEGNVIEMPPVPIAKSTLDQSVQAASNLPSPQAPPIVSTVDPELARTSFVSPAPGLTTIRTQFAPVPDRCADDEVRMPGPLTIAEVGPRAVSATISEAMRTPGRTETIRVPLFGRFSLEVKAKVVVDGASPLADVKAAPKD